MRLNRGAGVRGLAGIRPIAAVPGGETGVQLIRPLLGWRRSELVEICRAAGIDPVDDPSNRDEQFERVRVRRELAEVQSLDAAAMARSAANLAAADSALDWATDVEWDRQVSVSENSLTYVPVAPIEIGRRIVARAVSRFAREGRDNPLRGRELDTVLTILSEGGKTTVRGVLCSGGKAWRFASAPRRRKTATAQPK